MFFYIFIIYIAALLLYRSYLTNVEWDCCSNTTESFKLLVLY